MDGASLCSALNNMEIQGSHPRPSSRCLFQCPHKRIIQYIPQFPDETSSDSSGKVDFLSCSKCSSMINDADAQNNGVTFKSSLPISKKADILFYCNTCSYCTDHSEHLAEHLKFHGDPESILPCILCDFGAPDMLNMDHHLLHDHHLAHDVVNQVCCCRTCHYQQRRSPAVALEDQRRPNHVRVNKSKSPSIVDLVSSNNASPSGSNATEELTKERCSEKTQAEAEQSDDTERTRSKRKKKSRKRKSSTGSKDSSASSSTGSKDSSASSSTGSKDSSASSSKKSKKESPLTESNEVSIQEEDDEAKHLEWIFTCQHCIYWTADLSYFHQHQVDKHLRSSVDLKKKDYHYVRRFQDIRLLLADNKSTTSISTFDLLSNEPIVILPQNQDSLNEDESSSSSDRSRLTRLKKKTEEGFKMLDSIRQESRENIAKLRANLEEFEEKERLSRSCIKELTKKSEAIDQQISDATRSRLLAKIQLNKIEGQMMELQLTKVDLEAPMNTLLSEQETDAKKKVEAAIANLNSLEREKQRILHDLECQNEILAKDIQEVANAKKNLNDASIKQVEDLNNLLDPQRKLVLEQNKLEEQMLLGKLNSYYEPGMINPDRPIKSENRVDGRVNTV